MKNKDKGRLPPFVPLLKDTLDFTGVEGDVAWRAIALRRAQAPIQHAIP